jgi:hypothetical protein
MGAEDVEWVGVLAADDAPNLFHRGRGIGEELLA